MSVDVEDKIEIPSFVNAAMDSEEIVAKSRIGYLETLVDSKNLGFSFVLFEEINL